jgi:hypothetical protein
MHAAALVSTGDRVGVKFDGCCLSMQTGLLAAKFLHIYSASVRR